MRKLILASGSPRRKELLASLGFEFDVIVSNVEETIDERLTKEAIVKDLAYQKANSVFKENPEAMVIGSDTIVVLDDEILGKPHSKQQAREMMIKLRNRQHKVITGVAILSKEEKYLFHDTAIVHFNNITLKEIDKYIETQEPYDKAGGYAIQGWAAKYISAIEGNYYTIMGLPLDKVYTYLKKKKQK